MLYVLFLKVDDYISNVILRISNFVADYISWYPIRCNGMMLMSWPHCTSTIIVTFLVIARSPDTIATFITQFDVMDKLTGRGILSKYTHWDWYPETPPQNIPTILVNEISVCKNCVYCYASTFSVSVVPSVGQWYKRISWQIKMFSTSVNQHLVYY